MGEGEATAARRGLRVVAAGVALVLVVAAGAFGGNWLWAQYQAREQRLAAEVAARVEAAEKASPKGRQRELVRQWLFDGDSAEFRGERQSKGEPSAWCGAVNARNRMGAKVGFRRYVAVLELRPELQEPETRVHFERVDVEPDSSDVSKLVAFEQRWAAFCY